jgi:hypothetical protein
MIHGDGRETQVTRGTPNQTRHEARDTRHETRRHDDTRHADTTTLNTARGTRHHDTRHEAFKQYIVCHGRKAATERRNAFRRNATPEPSAARVGAPSANYQWFSSTNYYQWRS